VVSISAVRARHSGPTLGRWRRFSSAAFTGGIVATLGRWRRFSSAAVTGGIVATLG
jgi:hypothetical protein